MLKKKKVQHTNYPNSEQDLVYSEVGQLLSMHRPGAPSPASGEKHWTQAEGASDHSLLFASVYSQAEGLTPETLIVK